MSNANEKFHERNTLPRASSTVAHVVSAYKTGADSDSKGANHRAAHDQWFAREYPDLWPHVAAGEIGSALDVWIGSWSSWQAALSQPRAISDAEILQIAYEHYGTKITSQERAFGRAVALLAAQAAPVQEDATEPCCGNPSACGKACVERGRWLERNGSDAPAQDEPLKWEATTEFYIRYVTDSRYKTFSPAVQKWYRPICQQCTRNSHE